jgi:hypothetical protein
LANHLIHQIKSNIHIASKGTKCKSGIKAWREDMHLTDVYKVSKDLYGNNGKILKKGYDVIAHNSIRQSILSLRYNIKTVRCIKC